MSEENNEGKFTFEADLWPPRIKVTGDDPEWVEMMSKINLMAVANGAKAFIENLPEDDRTMLLMGNTKNQSKTTDKESYSQLPLFADIDTDETRQDASVPMPDEQNENYEFEDDSSSNSNVTLREFYHKLAIESQSDNLAAILFWNTHYMNRPQITTDDFVDGYKDLQYFGVEIPDAEKLKDRIKYARRQANYIYTVARGTYAINREGEERIKDIMRED